MTVTRRFVGMPFSTYHNYDTTVSSYISVRPQNNSLLLNGEEHFSNDTVYVSAKGSSTLKCSVDSKPQAQFTWSSEPDVFGPLTAATTCLQGSDKVYHCSNTLTVPNAVIPIGGVKVTCHVEAVGNGTDLCVTLGEFLGAFLPST